MPHHSYPEVAVWPENFKLTASEERALFTELRKVLPPRTSVGPPIDMGGKGIREVFEIVNVYLETGEHVAVLVVPLILWMRKRFKKSALPKKVKFIYGPDGEVMQTVTLRDPNGKPRFWRRKAKKKRR